MFLQDFQMSIFASPSRKYKKVFPQVEADNPGQSELSLGRRKQAALHSSSVALILKNMQTKFDQEVKLIMLIEIRLGFQYNLMNIQRFKEIWKEIQRIIQRHKWRQIKVLSIAFDWKYEGTLKDFEWISSLFIKSFPDLTTLSLKRIQDKNDVKLGYLLISKMSKSLLKIKDLYLEFDNYSNVSECIELLVSQTLSNLVKLQYLELNFSGSNTITSDDIELLCEGINKKASQLCSLTLNFGSCRNFNDECMVILGHKLCQKLSGLERLDLSMSINAITNQGVMDLSKFMSWNLPNLRFLNLDLFHSLSVTADGFEYLGQKIAENLRCLQELSFSCGVELQPGSEDYEEEDEEDNDKNGKGSVEKSLYDLRIEKETAYRNQISDKLNKLLNFIPQSYLHIDAEVVLG